MEFCVYLPILAEICTILYLFEPRMNYFVSSALIWLCQSQISYIIAHNARKAHYSLI